MQGAGSDHLGTYNDGLTAARRTVSVTLAADGLQISDLEGSVIAAWPYEMLRHRDEVFAGRPLQLKAVGGDARLTLDADLLPGLAERAPQLAAARSGVGGTVLKWSALSLLAVAALALALWVVLPRAARLVASVVPVSWEVALGEQVYEQFGELFAKLEGKDQAQRCTGNPAARAVLDDLTGRLAVAADSPYEFRIAVLNLETPNAFALPGGRIVILRGLLDFAQSPDEISGVLAHEMGHVIHRHGTEGIIKALGLTFFFGVMLGDLGSGTIGLMGETLVQTSFSREAESEADRDALDILTRGGLATGGLVAFFERLQTESGDVPALLQVLSSHPSHEDRLEMFAGAGSSGQRSLSDADWQTLKRICGDSAADES